MRIKVRRLTIPKNFKIPTRKKMIPEMILIFLITLISLFITIGGGVTDGFSSIPLLIGGALLYILSEIRTCYENRIAKDSAEYQKGRARELMRELMNYMQNAPAIRIVQKHDINANISAQDLQNFDAFSQELDASYSCEDTTVKIFKILGWGLTGISTATSIAHKVVYKDQIISGLSIAAMCTAGGATICANISDYMEKGISQIKHDTYESLAEKMEKKLKEEIGHALQIQIGGGLQVIPPIKMSFLGKKHIERSERYDLGNRNDIVSIHNS